MLIFLKTTDLYIADCTEETFKLASSAHSLPLPQTKVFNSLLGGLPVISICSFEQVNVKNKIVGKQFTSRAIEFYFIAQCKIKENFYLSKFHIKNLHNKRSWHGIISLSKPFCEKLGTAPLFPTSSYCICRYGKIYI